MRLLKVMMVLLCIAGLTGTAFAMSSGGGEEPPVDKKKVTICHVPPGNPENAHEITVSIKALDAHLAHGDYKGECKAAVEDVCTDIKEECDFATALENASGFFKMCGNFDPVEFKFLIDVEGEYPGMPKPVLFCEILPLQTQIIGKSEKAAASSVIIDPVVYELDKFIVRRMDNGCPNPCNEGKNCDEGPGYSAFLYVAENGKAIRVDPGMAVAPDYEQQLGMCLFELTGIDPESGKVLPAQIEWAATLATHVASGLPSFARILLSEGFIVDEKLRPYTAEDLFKCAMGDEEPPPPTVGCEVAMCEELLNSAGSEPFYPICLDCWADGDAVAAAKCLRVVCDGLEDPDAQKSCFNFVDSHCK